MSYIKKGLEMSIQNCKYLSRFVVFVFYLFLGVLAATLEGVYIQRFSTIENGGLLFTGNTLGLSKLSNQNQPGTADSAGAFITTDSLEQVGFYLPGTTLDWRKNSSTAFLDLPEGSTVLYAELIWSGSYGFENQITGSEPDTPVTLTTPQSISFTIAPDPSTMQTALTPGFRNAGNYTRSANVTSIIQAGGAGMYSVGGIPATISARDNTHNAAGWTLAVAYKNGLMLTYNMTIFVGCEQASSSTNTPAIVSGFCTPPSGILKGNLFVSAIEGDANKKGDRFLFGNSLPLTIANNSLSGVNNPINNFFGSQINTLLPLIDSIIPSRLIPAGSAELDTRGSFGNFNANPFTGVILPADRQGYDITSVDISNTLKYNQTIAYALGTTTGDDYTINSLGMQIQIGAPIIEVQKQVNGDTIIEANVGDVVTFTFDIVNTGTSDANSVLFKDTLETGLQFVSGSFLFNGIPQTDPDLNAGFSVGTLAMSQSATIQFQATITSNPISGSVFLNSSSVPYNFTTCSGVLTNLEANSNTVEINLPSTQIPNIEAIKLTNGDQDIENMVGDVVLLIFTLTNNGTGDAYNILFKDQLETGLSLVPGSVLVDGVVVEPDPNLSIGFLIGDLLMGESVEIIMQVSIDNYPLVGNTFFDTGTIDYQYMPSPGTFIDVSTTTNTISINVTPPPAFFVGYLKKCKFLNKTKYCLRTAWQITQSTDVLFYRIYNKGRVVAKIPANSKLVFKTCVSSPKNAQAFEVAAVYPENLESEHVKLRIINE